MADNGCEEGDKPVIDPDHASVQANRERVKNHLYRAVNTDGIDITAEDVELMHDALDTLSEDEIHELAKFELDLEKEVFDEERAGLDFMEISEIEREYFEFLSTILDRVHDK